MGPRASPDPKDNRRPERRVIQGFQDSQEFQVIQDPKVNLGLVLANQDHKVSLDLGGTWENQACKVIKVLGGTLACQVFPDRKATRASQESDYPASQGLKVLLEYRVDQGFLEYPDQEGRTGSLGELAQLGKRGSQGGACRGPRGPWGHRAFLDSRERRAPWGYLVSQDWRGGRGLLELRESKVIKGPQGLLGLRGDLAPQDQESQGQPDPREKQAHLDPSEVGG
ncbi:hypothetical protein COCON_G00200000 [Conger conger]|uniref:Uncharacterized protein n=1 Tax=Conger conger TaxID=82655 RepID=A0A9Q1D1X1_CONCO|nr:hypothetical protein COCON_G00200000 [Conger conger]